MIERDPLLELKAENARLIALLEANGIQWRTPLARTTRFDSGAITAFHGREGGAVSPVVPGTHGCLSNPLERQDFGEVGILASLH